MSHTVLAIATATATGTYTTVGEDALRGTTTFMPPVLDGPIELDRTISIPRSQAYFWTPVWQSQERESMEAYARGEFQRYAGVGDLEHAILGIE